MQCSDTSFDENFGKISENGEQCMDFSLYDADTTDSGYSDENICHSVVPKHFSNLIDSPLLLDNDPETSVCFSPVRKPLSERNSLSPGDSSDSTPSKCWLAKKRRANYNPECLTPSQEAASRLKRLKIFGLNEDCDKEQIKSAVEKSAEVTDLIGDFTKAYSLPVIPGFHPDLKAISPETMSNILDGKFEDAITSYKIIDSRYPYEFEGGHIAGAVNIYQKEECVRLLDDIKMEKKDERHVLIFHCEFSMERGPNMSRHLRKEDRLKNGKNYPELCYPEIYILEGGYKQFFQKFPQHCVPRTYKAMLHPEHEEDLRYFRKKSKSSDCDFRIHSRKPSKAVRKFLTTDD